jgi:hypothetical protein
MNIRASRHAAFVFVTLGISAGALVTQSNAVVANPAHVTHKSMSRSDAQAGRDRHAVFRAQSAGAFASAPQGETEGTCDVGDNPMIC